MVTGRVDVAVGIGIVIGIRVILHIVVDERWPREVVQTGAGVVNLCDFVTVTIWLLIIRI